MNQKSKTMKRIGILLLAMTIYFQSSGQESSLKVKQLEKLEANAPDSNEITKVEIGEKVVVEENSDGVKIRIGDSGVSILESIDNGSKIKFEKYDSDDNDFTGNDQEENGEQHRRHRRRFQGHWTGVEFGLANYMVKGFDFTLPDEIYYMDVHSAKSHTFNINFVQQSIGFGRHIGMVTGLGLNWIDYRFNGDNNIQKGASGVIEILEPEQSLKKSKFQTTFLTLPILFEGQIPAENHHMNIAAGVIGAVKLYSGTKMTLDAGDKVKTNDDLSMNVVRIGATARIGFGNFQIFSTYYFTPLFKTGKGPGGYDLYPVEIGMALTFNG
jgi:hypothetical protein